MTSFTSLLVATDFSPDGNNAVRRAALLAHEHGTRLHILHVVKAAGCKPLRDWFSPTMDVDLRAAQARAALQRVAVEITGAYEVIPTVEVVVGDPFETLLRASDRADLVVLGRRGRGRFSGLLVGGTADRLLRTCRRPVLVVRTPVAQSYRRVLVLIDFSASSDLAIRVAAQMRREASVQVFHAINSKRDALLRDADVPEHIIRETRLMEEAGTNARMRRKVAGLGLDCAPMSFALAYGPAVKSTLRHAQQLGADLIVAGKQGRSTVGGFLLGSVSRRVLSEAICDMMIVPRPRDSLPPQATPTVAPGLKSQPHPDNAALARSAAAHAEALTQGDWIHNTARFGSRRAS
jgi:nucleotide-binding universal stress UspA family protein